MSERNRGMGHTLLGKMGIQLPTDGMRLRVTGAPIADAIEKLRKPVALNMASTGERTGITEDCDLVFGTRWEREGSTFVSFIAKHRNSGSFTKTIIEAGKRNRVTTDEGRSVTITFDGNEAKAEVEGVASKPAMIAMGPLPLPSKTSRLTTVSVKDQTDGGKVEKIVGDDEFAFFGVLGYMIGIGKKTVGSPDGSIEGRQYFIKENDEPMGRIIFVPFMRQYIFQVADKFALSVINQEKGSRMTVTEPNLLTTVPIRTDTKGAETKVTSDCSIIYETSAKLGINLTVRHKTSGCHQNIGISDQTPEQFFRSDGGLLVRVSHDAARGKTKATIGPHDSEYTTSTGTMENAKIKKTDFVPVDLTGKSYNLGSGYALVCTEPLSDDEEGKPGYIVYSIYNEKEMAYTRIFSLCYSEDGAGEERTLQLGDRIIVKLSAKADGTDVTVAEMTSRN